MAQMEQRYVESPAPTTSSSSLEHFVSADASKKHLSMSRSMGRNHDQEDDENPNTKKSVLTKVKEKAKKWKHTLAKKKQDSNADADADDNITSALCDDNDNNNNKEEYEFEDPEYFGAPMYESEMAPEIYKETIRQHPRANPVISYEHILVSSRVTTANPDPVETQDKEEENPSKTITETMTEKLAPVYTAVSETVTEKLAPAYAMVSEATQTIASKLQGSPMAALTETTTQENSNSVQKWDRGFSSEQKWDKGVSVKEYLMQKLEPGEEEKALSQMISEVMSPKMSGDGGVVEKMREAFSSLLHGTNDSASAITEAAATSSASAAAIPPPPLPTINTVAAITPTPTPTKTNIPLSTNAYEVIEEENQGRIVQAN